MQINKVAPSFTGIIQVGGKIGDEAIRQTGLIDDACSWLSPNKTNIIKTLASTLEADIAVIPSKNGENVSLKILHSTDFGDFFAKGNNNKEITTTLNTTLSRQTNFAKMQDFINNLKKYVQEPNTEFINKKTNAFQSEWAREVNKIDSAHDKGTLGDITYYDKLYTINAKREFLKDIIYNTDADF